MKDINILLFLSDYKRLVSDFDTRGAKEISYSLDETGEKYKGTQTNDAPIRCLVEHVKKTNGILKRVICITSHMVLNQPADESQFSRFKRYVNVLALENGINDRIEFVSVPYDYDEKNYEKVDYGKKLPAMIYQKLSTCFETISEGEEVYIDYTGGFRDISFLMTSIIRFLEFKGLTCGEIVYSNIMNQKLFNIHYIYDIYQLINGINEFTNTGNARELAKVYQKEKDENPAGDLISRLIDFSDALSICDIGSLDEKVNGLVAAIDVIEKDESSDIKSTMMKTMAPIIRRKMYLDEGFDYPRIIRWCVENNMIQQAATIYTDKMPKYYFDNGLVPDYVDLSSVEISPGHNEYDTGFYTELFDRASEGLEVDYFRKSLKKIRLKFEEKTNRAEIISKIKAEQKHTQGLLYTAYNRLIDCIYKNYGADDCKLNKTGEFKAYKKYRFEEDNPHADEDGFVLEDGTLPGSFKQLWESLISTSNYWLHRFLYNNENAYLAIASPSKHNTDKTFRKKMYAIDQIKNGHVVLGEAYDRDRTYKLMAYYLAVKLMRNRMNHAGEVQHSHDEQEAITWLNTLGLDFEFKDDIASYRRIILEGLTI